MTTGGPRRLWPVVAGAVAALVLGVATTVVLAVTGPFQSPAPVTGRPPGAQCSAPAPAGHVVNVTVGDMGSGMMRGAGARTTAPGGSLRHGMGMMWLRVAPNTVPAGVVSLRVVNDGTLPHEVVVLPLPPGKAAGNRVVGAGGTVSEAGSLGEASRTCGAGSGQGIAPGAIGWTTVRLPPGPYELVCNFPGHYAAGMHTELDVTS